MLTWRNDLRARELDTITPPSITAPREGRERKSPIREVEGCGADRWMDSLQAEGEAGRGDDRVDKRGRQTAGRHSD